MGITLPAITSPVDIHTFSGGRGSWLAHAGDLSTSQGANAALIGIALGWVALALAGAFYVRWRGRRPATESTDPGAQAVRHFAASIEHVFWILETDPPRFVYLSEQFESLWGMSKSELDRDVYAWSRVVHADDRADVVKLFEQCLAGERESFRIEYRILRADGEERWICAEGSAIRDPSRRGLRISGIAKDITDRVRADARLRESEERLELALWGTGLGLWDWDIPAAKVYYNVQWANILGYHLDEIQPNIHAMHALTHPEESPAVLAGLTAHLEGKTPYFEAEHRMLGRDERWKWVLNRAKVVQRDAHGNALRLVGTIQDIDAQKLSEQRATALGTVLEDSLNEIYLFDAQTLECIQANRGARENSGYSEDEPPTLTTMDLCPDFTPHAWRELLKPLVAGRRRQSHFTTRHRRKDGSTYPVEVYLQAATFEGRTAAVVIALDITARRKAEERLRESEQQFRLAFEASAAGMALVSPQGAFLRVNPAFAEMLGYAPDQLVAKTVLDITHPADRDNTISRMDQMLHGGQPVLMSEKRYLRRDGHVVCGMISASLARTASGEPAYFVVQVRDITQRREAEHALQRRQSEEARFKSRLSELIKVSNILGAIDSLDDFYRRAIELGRTKLKFDRLGMWLLEPDGRGLRGTCGVDEQGRLRDERTARISISPHLLELTPKSPFRIFDPSDLYNEHSQVVGRGTCIWTAIWLGEQLIGYLSCDNLLNHQPLREKDGELLAVYASTLGHLISRKRAEQTLRDNELRFRQMAESRSRLLDEVNHRVRNNLTCLLSLIKHSPQTGSTAQFAQTMEQRVRAMTHTHNVLSESGWQDIDLETLLRAVTGFMLRTAPHPAPIDLIGPPVLLHPSLATPMAMTILEWFINSAKYGAHTSPAGRVRVRWSKRGENGDSVLRLRWTETGGPPILTPPSPGSGTTLMEGFIRYDLGGQCAWGYPSTGADHRIEIPLHPPQPGFPRPHPIPSAEAHHDLLGHGLAPQYDI